MLYRTGNCTYCARIAKGAFFFHFSNVFFFHNYMTCWQKKNPRTDAFFFHWKNNTTLPQKKVTRLDDFFVHELLFSPMQPPLEVWLGGEPTKVEFC